MQVVERSTRLEASADVVWAAVMTPHAFVHVVGGVLRFPPAERMDRAFAVGDVLEGWLLVGGLLPVSRHRIEVVDVDHARRRALTDERGGLVRTWRHELRVRPIDDATCRYTDRIDIDAGVVTPVVVGFARLLFAYRQRRWRRLARLLALSHEAA